MTTSDFGDGQPRCLLADDHPALMIAITRLLAENGFEVVGPAYDGRDAIRLAREAVPEVAVVDYRMPGLAGGALIARLREVLPDLCVVVYTADADNVVVQESLEAGASGVVLKQAPLNDLVRAARSSLEGQTYLDPALVQSGLVDLEGRSTGVLTARELEVLGLLADGLSHKEIGHELSISAETVRTHARNAAGRLGAVTRTQAVATALRDGLIV